MARPRTMKNETIEVLRTFSHPIRLRAMELLARKPHTIDDLTEKLPIERASVSSHVMLLRNQGLLKSSSGSRPVYHELDREVLGKAIADFVRCVRLDLRRK